MMRGEQDKRQHTTTSTVCMVQGEGAEPLACTWGLSPAPSGLNSCRWRSQEVAMPRVGHASQGTPKVAAFPEGS